MQKQYQKKRVSIRNVLILGIIAVFLAFILLYIPSIIIIPDVNSTLTPIISKYLPLDLVTIFAVITVIAFLVGLGSYYIIKNHSFR